MNLRGFTSRLGVAQTAIGMLFIMIGLRAALVPSQNDTFWHLRAGEEIWRTHRVPHVDTYSFTSGGWPWRDHEWLWQPVSYAFYKLGGMPLMTLFGGAVVVAAVVVSYRMMVGRASTKALLMVAWLPLLPSAWALRPQLVSLLAVPLLLTFLVRERFWPIPLLFVVWANVHGAVALGGVLLGVATAVAFARWRIRGAPEEAHNDRRRALALAVVLPLSGLACLVTPLGLGIFEFLTDSMRRIRAVHIAEWQSSFSLGFVSICFWIAAIAFVVLAIRRRRALVDGHASSWAAWALTACAFAFLPLAIGAMRNIGPLVLLAVPAASHLLGAEYALPARKREGPPPDPNIGVVNLVVLAAMVLASIGLVARSYRADDKELGWHPIDDRALAALHACDGPMYNHYDQGGYLLWFAPEKPVFVDGRQDPYPLAHVLAAMDVEREKAPYRPLFDRWGIRCVFLSVESPTVPKLDRDGWTTRYRDDKWTVLSGPPRP
jgi:hypothetical protein